MKDAVKKYWAVALMFLTVTAVCLLFGCRKSGMFIDEIYTYGLSNSSYAPYITDIKGGNAWIECAAGYGVGLNLSNGFMTSRPCHYFSYVGF